MREIVSGMRLGFRPHEARGQGRRGEQAQRVASIHLHDYTLPFLRSAAMYSLVRIARARIVHVTFLSAFVTNGPPSATNRFFTSWAWHWELRTDVRGLAPMRVVPTSWMI